MARVKKKDAPERATKKNGNGASLGFEASRPDSSKYSLTGGCPGLVPWATTMSRSLTVVTPTCHWLNAR